MTQSRMVQIEQDILAKNDALRARATAPRSPSAASSR